MLIPLFFVLLCLPVQAATLVRHYPLDGNADEVIVPGVGTLAGTPLPTFTTDSAVGTHAIRFTGTDGYATSPCGKKWGHEDSFALSVWFKRNGNAPAREYVVSQTAAGTWYVKAQGVTGKVCWMVRGDDSTGYVEHYSTSDLQDDKWHMLTIVHDAANDLFRLYADGILEKTTLYSEYPIANALSATAGFGNLTGIAYFGQWGMTGSPWIGDVDDLRIIDGALTDSEVMALFRGGIGGAGSPTDPNPANDAEVSHLAVTQLSWVPSTDPNIQSVNRYTVYFGTDTNPVSNPAYVTTNTWLPLTGGSNPPALVENMDYYWRVDPNVLWSDGNNVTITGSSWAFKTFAIDKVPTLTGSNVLGSMDYLPITLTVTVDDKGEGDIQTVSWFAVDPNATVTKITVDPKAATQQATVNVTKAGSYEIRIDVSDALNTVSLTLTVVVKANACLAAQASTSWTGFSPADIDKDCDVDFVDFARFAAQWLDNRRLIGQE